MLRLRMPPTDTASIRRLAPETASRIAAGEVIERPLSALKEILENAIDAGAGRIEVRVDGSLDRAFQVADDGCGIAADELELALERHATSKIGALEDLDRLTSLGFRGEALPSIAAVSRMRITSRRPDTEGAAFIAVDGGTVTSRGAASRAPGTTVEVSDLFHNTPARRKFLSSSTGELRAALRLIEALGLAHPQVSFRLVVGDRQRFDWPAARQEGIAGARERAASLWGARHAEQRLAFTAERSGFALQALLGLPEHARATREGQMVFVNRRWIQSPLVGHALRQAYGDLLPPGRFPVAALWISVPPDRLDVNVHPTKREVRFADDDAVFALVAGPCAQHLAHLHPPFTVVYGNAPEPRWAGRVAESPKEQTSLGLEPGPGTPAAVAPTAAAPSESVGEPELWQLHRTYVLAPVRGGLVIVDQHAAHERILYEEACDRLQSRQGEAQQLLFPALVDLEHDRFELLLEIGPSLEHLGWDLSLLGPPTVVIQGIPAGLQRERPGDVLRDILDDVARDGSDGDRVDVAERLARSYACHAAVKAGMPLTLGEMRTLVDRLFATRKPHGDPHGRPTYVRLELDDLHRRFGRS
ncbi:MAG TPA: DNA mismatch repair endonuclease MutL [Candidatus Eisenbacteria bacterium]|nr:DNA mismatch repair endonuclease MutL [Candidatus Eisenbacteria bacterium]